MFPGICISSLSSFCELKGSLGRVLLRNNFPNRGSGRFPSLISSFFIQFFSRPFPFRVVCRTNEEVIKIRIFRTDWCQKGRKKGKLSSETYCPATDPLFFTLLRFPAHFPFSKEGKSVTINVQWTMIPFRTLSRSEHFMLLVSILNPVECQDMIRIAQGNLPAYFSVQNMRNLGRGSNPVTCSKLSFISMFGFFHHPQLQAKIIQI